MSEEFSSEDIEEIIQENRDLVEGRREPFGVNKERLFGVFSQLSSFNRIHNKKDRIVKKASYILAMLIWQQPFSEGNKEIALSVAKLFLRRNGFDLPIHATKDEKEIFNLLIKTVYKFEGDSTIISKIEEYISKKVIEF
jgi:prophage maintenance system killer protein